MKNTLPLLKRLIPTLALAAMMLTPFWGWGQYSVNFDGASDATSASSYGFTDHNLNGITWTGEQVIIPTSPLAADWYNGVRSARLRGYSASHMTMTSNKANGIGTISFNYRRYGTDTQVTWKVEYSTDDGGSWTQVGSDFTAPSNDDIQVFSETVNVSGNARIRIIHVSGGTSLNRRLNIDDLLITDYTGSTPTITVTPSTLNGFTYVVGSGPSTEQTFTISGSNLTENIGITPPTNYEISTGTGASFSPTNPITLTQTSGTVEETTIYVRLKAGLSAGDYNDEDITATSTDATDKTVSCSGTVYGQIDWCNLQWPVSGNINLGGAFDVYARVFEPGITDAVGQGAGITAWIGYGTSSSDLSGYTWVAASYHGDDGTNNDEYKADIGAVIPVAGTYYYASRFQLGSSPFYVYGGFNGGFWDGTTNVSGTLTVNPPPQIDWVNLQSPASGSITTGGTFNVYAQVYEAGLTDAAGQGAGIDAWIGYHTENTNPATWLHWVEASYNTDAGNNDEYMANIATGLPAGTYYYVSRFKYGLADYVYGGLNGFWNASTSISGVLTVTAPEPSAHVTEFSATANSSSAITVSWTDSDADSYLIKGSDVSYNDIVAPEDGIAEADGGLVKNVASGLETYQFTGLDANTTYYFKVFPYNGSDAAVNYKIDGSVPEATAATTEAPVDPVLGDLIISEVSGTNVGTGDGFMEIYNTTAHEISLDNVQARYWNLNPNAATPSPVIDLNGSIPAKGFLVVARNESAFNGDYGFNPDFSASDFYLNGGDDGCDIYLTSTSTILDSFNDNGTTASGHTAWNWDDGSVWERTNTGSGAIEANWTEYTDGEGTPKVLLSISWVGGTDVYWNTIANWDKILPGAYQNVTIPSGKAGIEIAADKTADCYDLNVDGSLTIKSDASGTGSLIINGTVSGSGTTTMERYLTGGWDSWDAGWHQISSPVAAQPISAFETTGAGNDYDFYGWDETTNMWMNYKDGGFGAWNGGANFNVGQGYLVSYEAANTTQTFTGLLNTADVLQSNLSTNGGSYDGWHLLGNPFASALIWNETVDNHWALSNVAGTAKIWHEANKSYSDIAANGIIPSAQGFMVQVESGTNSITIPADSRVHDAQPFYKSRNAQLLLVATETEGGSAQESKIIVNPMATEGFDFDYDSRFLAGYAPTFYSVAGDELLSTNSFPSIDAGLVIPFGFVKNAASSFSIQLKESIDGRVVYLTDTKTGTVSNLTETPVYSFTSSDGDDANRFLLSFGTLGINNPEITDGVQVYAFGEVLYIGMSSKEAAQVNVYNLTGQLVMQGKTSGNTLSTYNASALDNGIYVVNVVMSNQVISRKVVIRN